MLGERRGGRTRGTPNRRTILADRILAVLPGCSAASFGKRLAMLVNDPELPADIRMAVAQRGFPGRAHARPRSASHPYELGAAVVEARRGAAQPFEKMSRATLEYLTCIACDVNASDKVRRKVAMQLATYFLPKRPATKRWSADPDNHGFAVNAEHARVYRDIALKLRQLEGHPNRDFPEFAQKIAKLKVKTAAFHKRVACPCPSRYGHTEIDEDRIRLGKLARKRERGTALTTEEDAEEAHRKARFDCYEGGPEDAARRYRKELEKKDDRFRMCRAFREAAQPLSRKEHNDLWLLRWLYPPLYTKPQAPEAKDEAQSDDQLWVSHPFYDEPFWVDGNLYPEIPPDNYYVYYTGPGQPMIHSYEPPEVFYKRRPDLAPANRPPST